MNGTESYFPNFLNFRRVHLWVSTLFPKIKQYMLRPGSCRVHFKYSVQKILEVPRIAISNMWKTYSLTIPLFFNVYTNQIKSNQMVYSN